ncbi:DUF3251 domain-containing protein [Qipengyuania huizhouensis]|uniref:DUF3251 domain-containing protein n=1 Tax=Qipengyuania huizhouensis TaxID=2867245 RepID=UPI001C88D986|nr:DUF3251 domain-containing protein [Qipengyuania huizhouensis]MBX7461507.1 DUF3251 domain-containing protein [Qipengyuania huizhouensis]
MGRVMLLCCLALGACSSPSSDDAAYRSLEAEIRELETRLQASEDRLLRHVIEDTPGSVWLRQSDDGYSYLRNELGSLSFQLEGIEASGQGSRVAVTIGNPTTARITKLSLSGEWGQLNAEGAPDMDTAKPFDLSVSAVLQPGSWNEVEFVLDSAKPSELGYINIEQAEPQAMTLNAL